MAYFSTIRINPFRAASRLLLSNPRAMHGAVLGGLAEYSAAERTLWRVDAQNARRPVLLVVTESKPDWTHIVEQAGWPNASGDHCLIQPYEPRYAALATGQEYDFRVTANPVHSVPRSNAPPQGRHTVRTGLRDPHAQLAWFTQRSAGWGFEPTDEVRITDRRRLSFSKGGSKREVTLITATFEGTLRVLDAVALAHTLRGGLGPAKAYGCGLLTISEVDARASEREQEISASL